ncbi:hypothetical protein Syun_017117 [Stephania yunnanensis]|uniref:AB hydrolase-1 domain-containing protein n=1 Tax=Stephania yunnanensis TaxID=152371 RepID=A0AAP0P4N3_9MAGN
MASNTSPFIISKFVFPVSDSQRKKRFESSAHFGRLDVPCAISSRVYSSSRLNSNGCRANSSSDASLLDPVDDKIVSDPGTTGKDPDVHSEIWNWRGYSIRYQYSGENGHVLVLIHGFGANSDHWRKNMPVLANSSRVYSIDLIGYGYSDKPNPRDFGAKSFYTFETWASQLNDFCTEVVKGEAFFICNSIGGIVGLQAAVMEPHICKGIILLNISLRMLHIKKQPWYGKPFISTFQNLLRNTVLGEFFYKAVATPQSVRNILCQVWS